MTGLPGYLLGCFPVLPGWGVRCSRSYREGGHRTSLPIGPATAARPGRTKPPRTQQPADHREDRMTRANSRTTPETALAGCRQKRRCEMQKQTRAKRKHFMVREAQALQSRDRVGEAHRQRVRAGAGAKVRAPAPPSGGGGGGGWGWGLAAGAVAIASPTTMVAATIRILAITVTRITATPRDTTRLTVTIGPIGVPMAGTVPIGVTTPTVTGSGSRYLFGVTGDTGPP